MLNKFKKNTYIKNIATLMSGTLVAQVIMLIFFPILTRLYTPGEFGIFAFFVAITSIFGLVSSLKYDQAIMLPRSDKDALTLACLSVCITMVTAFIVTIVVLLFFQTISDKFDGINYIVWMIPVGVLLTGILQILNAYSSRYQQYRNIATVRVVNALSITSIQVGSQYFFKLNGLIVGTLLGNIISIFLLMKYHIKNKTLQLRSLSHKRLKANIKRHKNFPKYQSLTVFFNSVSQNMPVLLFGVLYSAEIAGFYALAVRILQVPIGLVGASTRTVYYQKASKMYAAGEDILSLYYKTTIWLIKLFILPFFLVLFFAPSLFGFIFGEEWKTSGYMAQILVFWFLFSFINPPSVMTFSILGLQEIQMKLEILSLVFRVTAIYSGYYFFDSYTVSILLFMLISVMINIIIISVIFTKLRRMRI